MRWTNKTPTEDGYYWYEGSPSDLMQTLKRPIIVEVSFLDTAVAGRLQKVGIVDVVGSPYSHALNDLHGRWSERLAAPSPTL